MPSLFQTEKDAIVFLGLMTFALKNFDQQFKHHDGTLTHLQGLNIFATIIDNTDGEPLGICQNKIHGENNPLLHAEQLTLATAIKRVNSKRPRNRATVSVENYYRNFLFNDPSSKDYLHTGSTLYTTLEPCPFCTSALLVNRMKRIVFLIPDKKFGGAYGQLKEKYYPSSDMHYEQLSIEAAEESEMTMFASTQHKQLLQEIARLKQGDPTLSDTLLLDFMQPVLQACAAYFIQLTPSDLKTSALELQKNTTLLQALQLL